GPRPRRPALHDLPYRTRSVTGSAGSAAGGPPAAPRAPAFRGRCAPPTAATSSSAQAAASKPGCTRIITTPTLLCPPIPAPACSSSQPNGSAAAASCTASAVHTSRRRAGRRRTSSTAPTANSTAAGPTARTTEALGTPMTTTGTPYGEGSAGLYRGGGHRGRDGDRQTLGAEPFEVEADRPAHLLDGLVHGAAQGHAAGEVGAPRPVTVAAALDEDHIPTHPRLRSPGRAVGTRMPGRVAERRGFPQAGHSQRKNRAARAAPAAVHRARTAAGARAGAAPSARTARMPSARAVTGRAWSSGWTAS